MDPAVPVILVWAGIFFCLSQSAIFSGLNLALLGISRLRLEVSAHGGDANAIKILNLRQDVNFLLTTILWGNVGINVLLTLLSNSVMAGLLAFGFSTIIITFFGEIVPQAYFSRHAIRIGAALSPLIRFYQFLLYPVAKPSALVLDKWLGKEGISYFREKDLLTVLQKHKDASTTDISHLEGLGAINFLKLDDTAVDNLGETLEDESIIQLPFRGTEPIFSQFEKHTQDAFLQRVNGVGRKWVIIVDEKNHPHLALNANAFLRDALFSNEPVNPMLYCHRPIIVENGSEILGKVLNKFQVKTMQPLAEVIENDLILVWAAHKKIITGTNILSFLLQGIARR